MFSLCPAGARLLAAAGWAGSAAAHHASNAAAAAFDGLQNTATGAEDVTNEATDRAADADLERLYELRDTAERESDRRRR